MGFLEKIFGSSKKEDPVEEYKDFLKPGFVLDEKGYNLIRQALAAWDELGTLQSKKGWNIYDEKFKKSWTKQMNAAEAKLLNLLKKIFKESRINLTDWEKASHLQGILSSLARSYK